MNIETIDRALLRKALRGSVKFLEANKEEVNSLNVFPVPDGDTGTNMFLTFDSAVKEALQVEDDDTYLIALGLSKGSLMGARGNSGVILSQLCRGFASGLEGKKTIAIKDMANALESAADTAYKAVMKPTEGTILTVARECGEYAQAISRKEKDMFTFLKKVIDHGNESLARTQEMLPVLKEAGVVDAGGQGLMYILMGAYNGLLDTVDLEDEEIEKKEFVSTHKREHIMTDDIKYGYCTEFMINTDYDNIEQLRKEFSLEADSLLVVGGEGIIKVHVHTNDPGKVLSRAVELGQLTDIKIDNMRHQHEEILLKEELENMRENEAKEEVKKEATEKYSFVSVSTGEGLDEIFRGFNVDHIVSGGQTMNPSTEDILKAIEDTDGKNVFILPNNKNIILAAEQTKELSDRNVVVVPTRSIPEGIGALLVFDESLSPEENLENMNDYIEYVHTGQVTYAVRDTEVNGNKIDKDDIIGLADGDIVTSGKDIDEVSLNLIEKMVNEDIAIITIFYGKETEEAKAEELAEKLEEKYPDLDVEVAFGGQPLYYYIFSLE